MNDNTISDSSHRQGQQKEFVASSSLSVVQMFSAVQGEENRRKLLSKPQGKVVWQLRWWHLKEGRFGFASCVRMAA